MTKWMHSSDAISKFLNNSKKEELGDGSEIEIDAVLDKIEADKGIDK